MTTISAGAGPSTTSRGLRPSPQPPVSLRSTTAPLAARSSPTASSSPPPVCPILTTVGIVLSLLFPALAVLPRGEHRRVPDRDHVDAALRRPGLRRPAADHRDAVDDGHRPGPRASRSVSAPRSTSSEYASTAHPQGPQAGPRAARRRPVGRLRLLRRRLRRARRAQRAGSGIEVGTFSVLAAGLVLGVMIIPTVASLAEDAMSAVPRSLRRGVLRPGRQPDAHRAAGGLPGRDLRHRRLDRPRPQPRRRRDDDRRHGRGEPGQDGHRTRSRAARR